MRAINHQRSRYGLAGLRTSARLAKAADFHSWEMLDANYFAHESRDGSPFDKRVRRYANHNALGETLAMLGGCSRRSARKIVRMWMNSPPHRAVLLSGSYRRVGIGTRVGDLGGEPRLRRHRGFRLEAVENPCGFPAVARSGEK